MMIRTAGLSYSYGKRHVLNDIGFSVGKGKVVSLVGPNGSGKSTFLRCLCGILSVGKGCVYIDGRPIESFDNKSLSRQIAFLPQFHQRLGAVTVNELIAMGRTPHNRSGWFLSDEDRSRIDSAIEAMKIEDITGRMVETLSGGEKQRVWIAMILAQDTPIVLLDEPVTYMDLRHQWDLLKIIRNLKDVYHKTVVSVFHDVNHAMEVSDSIYLLKDGYVYAAGSPENVITRNTIRDVYGVRAQLHPIGSYGRSVLVPEGLGRKPMGADSLVNNYKNNTIAAEEVS